MGTFASSKADWILDEALEYGQNTLRHLEKTQDNIKILRRIIFRSATNGSLLRSNLSKELSSSDSNYYIPDSWVWRKFKEVAEVASHLVDPSDYLSFPHIAPNHIESKTGRLLPYTTVEADGVKSVKHLFKKGQILYSKIRPNLAKVIIVDFDGLCSADMYPIETTLCPEYLLLWLLSDEFTQQVSQIQGRTVLPKVNKKELGEILVPVPPQDEQERIVQISQISLNFINQVEDKCESTKVLLEELHQNLLSKAIKGELSPQIAQDESASELLKKFRSIPFLTEITRS